MPMYSALWKNPLLGDSLSRMVIFSPSSWSPAALSLHISIRWCRSGTSERKGGRSDGRPDWSHNWRKSSVPVCHQSRSTWYNWCMQGNWTSPAKSSAEKIERQVSLSMHWSHYQIVLWGSTQRLLLMKRLNSPSKELVLVTSARSASLWTPETLQLHLSSKLLSSMPLVPRINWASSLSKWFRIFIYPSSC